MQCIRQGRDGSWWRKGSWNGAENGLKSKMLRRFFVRTQWDRNKHTVFRRVNKIAKSDYQLHHVCSSVRPSVRMDTTRIPRDKFSWNFIFQYFSKFRRGNSSFIKIGQEQRALHGETNRTGTAGTSRWDQLDRNSGHFTVRPIGQEQRALHGETNVYFWPDLAHVFLEWKNFGQNF
jgi:hypothetical protein